MHKVLSILDLLTAHLPEIKKALGEHWPVFAEQMRGQAPAFKKLATEEDLSKAANELLGIFMVNEIACEILTRPTPTRIRRPQPKVETEISLETIANRFYDLCSTPDEAAEKTGSTLDKEASPPNRKSNYG